MERRVVRRQTRRQRCRARHLTAYHAVQNNPVVRDVETKVANVGLMRWRALARAWSMQPRIASFLVGQPEVVAAADVGVHNSRILPRPASRKVSTI